MKRKILVDEKYIEDVLCNYLLGDNANGQGLKNAKVIVGLQNVIGDNPRTCEYGDHYAFEVLFDVDAEDIFGDNDYQEDCIRDMAIRIVDMFDDFLTEHGITVRCNDFNEEVERVESDCNTALYGMEYWNLQDKVIEILKGEC